MLPKVIALDLDGTLLDRHGNVSNETKEYLKELENKGHLIVLASQNPINKVKEIRDSLKLNSPYICQDGSALCFSNEEENVILGIPLDILHRFFKDNDEIIKSSFYSYESHTFIYKRMTKMEFFYQIKEDTIVHEVDFKTYDLINPNNLMIVANAKLKDKFEESLLKYNNTISYRFVGADLSDAIYFIQLKNVNKSYALLELLMKLKLTTDDVLAIGDSAYDSHMLSLFTGVCMINGEDEAKLVSEFITDYDNNNDGVMKFLKKYDNMKK